MHCNCLSLLYFLRSFDLVIIGPSTHCRSAEDEDLDTALKLAQCDIYERRLREQVRRKRVARDYQLVSKFYDKNPIVTIGKGTFSPQKTASQIKAVKKGDGPKAELMEALKGITQFHTAQEFQQVSSL